MRINVRVQSKTILFVSVDRQRRRDRNIVYTGGIGYMSCRVTADGH